MGLTKNIIYTNKVLGIILVALFCMFLVNPATAQQLSGPYAGEVYKPNYGEPHIPTPAEVSHAVVDAASQVATAIGKGLGAAWDKGAEMRKEGGFWNVTGGVVLGAVGAGPKLIGQVYKGVGWLLGRVAHAINPATPTNAACKLEDMQVKYYANCYSCMVVKTLIETFMNACAKVYSLCRDAGNILLFLGAMLWMAFFALKNVSSFANVEPGEVVTTLLTMIFKLLFAYLLLNAGINAILGYIMFPLLGAGADFGLLIIEFASDNFGALAVDPNIVDEYTYRGTTIINPEVLSKLLKLNQGIDRVVATNLVVGHSLTCHADNAGQWTLVDSFLATIRITDPLIWLVGAFIWVIGFLLTLSVSYYLLDISFKLGIAIILLPITIGLWPFPPTKDKLAANVSIILNAAATFAFLALTTTFGLILCGGALGDVNNLLDAIAQNDATAVSQQFDPGEGKFLIILFAYLYAMKLVGKTSEYVDHFFADKLTGGVSPMHHKLKQMTDAAKKAAMAPVKYGADVVKDRVKKKAKKIGGKIGKFVSDRFRKKKDISDNGVEKAGKATKSAGKGVEAAGKGVEAAGKGVEAGGKAAGQSLAAAGGAVAAIPIPVVAQAVGAAIKAAGKAVEATMVAIGKTLQKVGKGMQKIGKGIQKVGDGMKKAGGALKKARGKIGKKVGGGLEKMGQKVSGLGSKFEKLGQRLEGKGQKISAKGEARVQKGQGAIDDVKNAGKDAAKATTSTSTTDDQKKDNK